MILKNIALTNFRTHRSLNLILTTGITGILGTNGAGKSTIIEAILWAFYGNLASRTTADQIKSSTADESDSTNVTITFELQGEDYTITREIKGKSQTPAATITKNDLSLATSPKEVTNYMTKLLGNMNFQAFTMSVVARQSELAALSDVKPANREKIIRQMLGIDEIDTAIDSIRTDKRDLSKQINVLEPTLTNPDGSYRLTTYTTDLTNLTNQITNDISKLTTTTTLITTQQDIETNLNTKIKLLESQHNEMHELELQLSTITTQNQNQQTQLEKLTELIQYNQELQLTIPALQQDENSYQFNLTLLDELQLHKSTQDQIIHLDTPISTHQALNVEYNKEIKHLNSLISPAPLQNMLNNTNNELETIQKTKTIIETQITKLISKIMYGTTTKSTLYKTLSDLKQLGPQTPCPTCTRIIGDKYDELINSIESNQNSNNSSLNILDNELVATRITKTSIDTEITNLEQQSTELNTLIIQTQIAKGSLNEKHIQINNCNNKLNTLIAEQIALQKELPKDLNLIEIPKIQQNISKLKNSHEQLLIVNSQLSLQPGLLLEKDAINKIIIDLKTQINDLSIKKNIIISNGYSNSELEQIKIQLSTITTSIQSNIQDKIKLESIIENNNSAIDRTNISIKNLTKSTDQLKTFKSELQLLESIAGDRDTGYMVSFRRTLISRIRPQLSQIASDLITQMTDGKYTQIELDENYNILMSDESILYDIIRFSGGERDIANLCIRIAIAKLIAERHGSEGLSFIILDEIFATLDASRKNLVLTAINSMTTIFDQILLITHSDEIKDELPHQITINQRG